MCARPHTRRNESSQQRTSLNFADSTPLRRVPKKKQKAASEAKKTEKGENLRELKKRALDLELTTSEKQRELEIGTLL